MVDKDTELLSRVITNHLFLGQFEPFRATLLTLRSRNPNLARTILQTIVSKGGRFDNLLFSPSCPSPAHLTHLCTLELLQFNDPCLGVWSFGVDSLRLRAEFSLCVQIICSRVGDSVKESVSLGENVEIEGDDRVLAGNAEFGEGLRVLERVLEVGLSRLRPGVVDEGDDDDGGVVEFEEEEFGCLKKIVLENAELFEALSENVEKQVRLVESEDMGLGRKVDADIKVFRMIQRVVQGAHLDAMSECLKDGDEDGVISHVRFLHLDYGVEESKYRYV